MFYNKTRNFEFYKIRTHNPSPVNTIIFKGIDVLIYSFGKL